MECKNEIRGDIIVVKKMDEGLLGLFELILICENFFDICLIIF